MATKKTTAKKPATRKTAAPKATKGNVLKKKSPAKAVAKSEAKADPAKTKKPSAIDAAAQVLAGSKTAMNAKQMVEAMATQGLWTSPGGKTPHATLYSAILREINAKGKDSRFKKTERGQFAANG